MQMGGHVGEVFARLKEGVEKLQERIPFSSDPRLGMLTFCPTNLGTTIRARQVPPVSVRREYYQFSQCSRQASQTGRWRAGAAPGCG